MLQRITTVAIFMLLATPAAAEWRIPCLSALFGSGCSVTFVSPEYAARPVQPLKPQAALVEVSAFRAKNGLKPVVLDARLSRAAAMKSVDQARRSSIGHYGSDGSRPKDRAQRAGYHPKIVAENVASGQKSLGDVLRGWEESSAIGTTCCFRT
jgi:uncharacterized protein YkwD